MEINWRAICQLERSPCLRSLCSLLINLLKNQRARSFSKEEELLAGAVKSCWQAKLLRFWPTPISFQWWKMTKAKKCSWAMETIFLCGVADAVRKEATKPCMVSTSSTQHTYAKTSSDQLRSTITMCKGSYPLAHVKQFFQLTLSQSASMTVW